MIAVVFGMAFVLFGVPTPPPSPSVSYEEIDEQSVSMTAPLPDNQDNQRKETSDTVVSDRDLFYGHPHLYTAEQIGSFATNPYLGLTPEQAIVMLAFDADGNLHTPVSYNASGAVVSDPVWYTRLDVVVDLIAQQGDRRTIDPAMFDPQYVTMIGERYSIDPYEQRDDASQTINYAPKPQAE